MKKSVDVLKNGLSGTTIFKVEILACINCTELKNGHQIDDSLPFDVTCQS